LLLKVSLAPTGTTVTAGTNCIFSWVMLAVLGSSGGADPPCAGRTITTASATGRPSRSSTVTVRVAAMPVADQAKHANAANACSGFIGW
jgi:hypothetical protein